MWLSLSVAIQVSFVNLVADWVWLVKERLSRIVLYSNQARDLIVVLKVEERELVMSVVARSVEPVRGIVAASYLLSAAEHGAKEFVCTYRKLVNLCPVRTYAHETVGLSA